MSNNYLMPNGKRIDLTEAPEVKGKIYNPYQRALKLQEYYMIGRMNIVTCTELEMPLDDEAYDLCNYFTDRATAKQINLHQILYRKLLKFAYDNNCYNTLAWNGSNTHYYIYHDYSQHRFNVDVTGRYHSANVWFSSRKSAEQAIEEVVIPFMKEHPEFKW